MHWWKCRCRVVSRHLPERNKLNVDVVSRHLPEEFQYKTSTFAYEYKNFYTKPNNKSNHTTSQQVGASARTRYYERATLLFKRAVLLLILKPYLVGTKDMMADIFTKAVDKPTFVRMRNGMMNIHGGLRSVLERSYNASTGQLRRLIGSAYDCVARS